MATATTDLHCATTWILTDDDHELTRECRDESDARMWARIEGGNPVEVYAPELLTSGDYSGAGAVGVANRRSWEEEFEEGLGWWWWHSSDCFGYEGILVRMTMPPRAAEFLRALEDYPVADEEQLYEVEEERRAEAWDSWVAHEYEKLVQEGLPDGTWVEGVTRCGFEMAAQEAGEYWEDQQEGAYIQVGRVARWVLEHHELELGGIKLEKQEQEEDEDA